MRGNFSDGGLISCQSRFWADPSIRRIGFFMLLFPRKASKPALERGKQGINILGGIAVRKADADGKVAPSLVDPEGRERTRAHMPVRGAGRAA